MSEKQNYNAQKSRDREKKVKKNQIKNTDIVISEVYYVI